MPLQARLLSIAWRTVIAAICALGVWYSLNLARADYLFRQNTEQSVRAAIRLEPDAGEYYMHLALFDDAHAQNLLETAIKLDPYNAQADIELGLRLEAAGDYPLAEKQLLEAYDVDHTYLPRWSLANFYFRRDNLPAFWVWARSAADMPADDIGPLFELCWRVTPDPEKIANAILNDKPELIRQYITFLLAKDQLGAVAVVVPHLIRLGNPETDRPLLFSVVNRLVASDDAAASNALWHLLIQQQWVIADTTPPNNGDFLREPLPVSFDWSLPEYAGLHSWPGSSGLETEFTGSQPEDCIVAEQVVDLTPGNYTMAYAYHTSDIPPDTGIHWQVLDTKSNTIIAQSPDLSSDGLKNSAMEFSVPPDNSLFRLRLVYKRALGTPRISGMLVILSTRIQAKSQS